jgi:uncharacterized protein
MPTDALLVCTVCRREYPAQEPRWKCDCGGLLDVRFGAFVDVGVHQDGLVHISELSDKFVKNPSDVVKVQQKVTAVTVLSVDVERNRIALSLRTNPGAPRQNAPGVSAEPATQKGRGQHSAGKPQSTRADKGENGGWFLDLLKSPQKPGS